VAHKLFQARCCTRSIQKVHENCNDETYPGQGAYSEVFAEDVQQLRHCTACTVQANVPRLFLQQLSRDPKALQNVNRILGLAMWFPPCYFLRLSHTPPSATPFLTVPPSQPLTLSPARSSVPRALPSPALAHKLPATFDLPSPGAPVREASLMGAEALPPATGGVDREQVQKAVQALLKWIEKQKKQRPKTELVSLVSRPRPSEPEQAHG